MNIAKPMTVTENSAKPIWAAEADSFYEKQGWNTTEEIDIIDDGAKQVTTHFFHCNTLAFIYTECEEIARELLPVTNGTLQDDGMMPAK